MVNQLKTLKVAILDLYEGQANEGMRCIREILNQYGKANDIDVQWDEFEVRLQMQVPDLSYDVYISSGGPGSPLDTFGSQWELQYFNWLNQVLTYNYNPNNLQKKYVFFICHSFQLACRHFKLATVNKRRSTSFGVFPMHKLPAGNNEIIFEGLKDPFYAIDSRDYQVTQPDQQVLRETGAKVLCIEKERPHVPLERAVMAIRFTDEMVGTQFHPEADAAGMSMYLQREDKKQTVIANHGEAKWRSMIEHLNDPDKILYTYSHILPNFLHAAIGYRRVAEWLPG
jgi:homoserine O-succinyltransferase/O-acetyltransferase